MKTNIKKRNRSDESKFAIYMLDDSHRARFRKWLATIPKERELSGTEMVIEFMRSETMAEVKAERVRSALHELTNQFSKWASKQSWIDAESDDESILEPFFEYGTGSEKSK